MTGVRGPRIAPALTLRIGLLPLCLLQPFLVCRVGCAADRHRVPGEEITMQTRTKEAQALQALADRKQAKAPSTTGPTAIIRECMKCGYKGCSLIESEEKR
jgi:hypothetical protein